MRRCGNSFAKLGNATVPRVSEHAVLRYLERVKGYNIAEVEHAILTPKVLKMIETLGGTGKFPGDGFTIVMKDYTVTTITE